MKKAIVIICAVIIVVAWYFYTPKALAQVELDRFIGQDLTTVETTLATRLKDMTRYFDNTYRFDVDSTLVDFTVDESGKIVRIHLWESGDLEYTLLGLSTEMDNKSATEMLTESGAQFFRGTTWQLPNGTAAITREDSGWIYETNFIQREYDRACVLLEYGDYDDALSIFKALGNYKDSKRHIDGIQCVNYADQVSTAITTQYYSLRLVGINIYCEYIPENYTFSVVWEVPNSGLFGQLSSIGVAAGEKLTYSEEGAKKLAQEVYYDYFFPKGYTGIVCEYEIRDMANDTYLKGKYALSDEDLEVGAHG